VETTTEEITMIGEIIMIVTTMVERIITEITETIAITGIIVIKIHKPFMLGPFCSNQILFSRL
jgi:hypothetical protein